MVARSFYLKCFLLAELQGGRDGPEFTSVNTIHCFMLCRTESWTVWMHSLYGFVFTKEPAEFLVSVSTNKSSPYFHFLLY